MDLFDLVEPQPPAEQPVQSYRDGLLEQIRRDVETLAMPHPEPSREFYEQRLASYREEFNRLGERG